MRERATLFMINRFYDNGKGNIHSRIPIKGDNKNEHCGNKKFK